MDAFMRVTIKPPLDQVLKDEKDRIPVVVRKILDRAGLEGERQAKILTPVDTGRLRASIHHQPEGANREIIGTNVEYAPFILLDTKPFTIRALGARALAWLNHKGKTRPAPGDANAWAALRGKGMAVYAKYVTHPGGRDVVGKTMTHLKTKIPKIVATVLKQEGIT